MKRWDHEKIFRLRKVKKKKNQKSELNEKIRQNAK
jgi:hypothetical protein